MIASHKLNPIYKQQVLDALRGGEYEQGYNGYLRETSSSGLCLYCVLGVAAKIADPKYFDSIDHDQSASNIILTTTVADMLFGDRIAQGGPMLSVDAVQTFLGFDLQPYINKLDVPGFAGGAVTLPILNDNGLSFDGLANIIEEFL